MREAQVGNHAAQFEADPAYTDAIDGLTKAQLRDALLIEYEGRRAWEHLCHAIHDETSDWARDVSDVVEYLPE